MSASELYKTALAKTMALCSLREYSVEDIKSKLQMWGVGDKDAGKIIDLLKKENFLDEVRFSKAFVKDKFKYNKWGKLKIRAHLKLKSVPEEIINQALVSIDHDLYIMTLRELLKTHSKTIKAKNQFDLKGKLLRFGLSKGFESNLLYDLLNDIE